MIYNPLFKFTAPKHGHLVIQQQSLCNEMAINVFSLG
jgi:hypothetical protein